MEQTVWKEEDEQANLSRIGVSTSLLAGACLACLSLWFVLTKTSKWSEFGKRVDKLPGPFSVPLLGTLALILIRRKDILDALVKWSNKFKGCFRLWLLNEPIVFISSPEYVQKILGSTEHLAKTDESSSRKTHRKLLIRAVNGTLTDVFLEICNEYFDILNVVLEKDKSISPDPLWNSQSRSKTTDLRPYINRYILDAICDVVLGKSPNTLRNNHWRNIEFGDRHKEICSKRWFSWKWLCAIHPFRKSEESVATVIKMLVTPAIQERREFHKNKESEKKYVCRGTLLDTFLDAQKDSKNEITDEYINSELLTFLVAGQDIAAAAILWCLFLLGNNLDEQEKVYQELVRLSGSNKSPRFTLDDLQRMTYMDQCIKETLRLYPSAPLYTRVVHGDVILDEDIVIPSGTDVCICVPAVHQNPSIYPNPKKFDPQRFSAENNVKRHPFAFTPFSTDPRNWIGKKLGEIVTKVGLARFLLSYSIVSTKKPEQVKTVMEITLGPFKPVNFYVKRR